ncbi:hypothetical protein K1T71_003599 [Dendrolimus kikuchii]|uniref:Uncharacterized protein n=1 Tax=Dendrolimus kikuchii TaxID=765133 RepID=A0ACC1DC43_9NEOP|nr:hypothetical protein K1T71_003599 [Dendrolimus kikuchii]
MAAMAALLPLLAALLPTLAAGPPAPSTPPALLVLRVACSLRDHGATCGPDWRMRVAREALGALTAGGVVACAGWPGRGVCDALASAGRLLRRPQPSVCALPSAQGAVVAELAARLGWRRALVPAPTQESESSECAGALFDVRRALLGAGLLVGGAPPPADDDDTASRPQVVIMCASGRSGGVARLRSSMGAGRPAVLLLHVEELDPPAQSEALPPDDVTLQTSNISLEVEHKLHVIRTLKSVDEDRSAEIPAPRNAFTEHSMLTNADKGGKRRSRTGLHSYSGEELNKEPTTKIRYNENSSNGSSDTNATHVEFETNGGYSRSGGRKREARASGATRADNRNPFLRAIDEALPLRLLLLSPSHLGVGRGLADRVEAYESVLQEVERITRAELARRQVEHRKFWLFERSEDRPASPWSRVAVVGSVSTRSLDDSGEWETAVTLDNVSASLDRWGGSHSPSEAEGDWPNAGVLLSVIGAVVAVMGSAGAVARWAASRRRRKRRLGDAVLSPAEFSFPADEQRRVGEGMETMLSCWLQQLHEFGGPELERPDLLKQPPRVTRAPSAPSSTCSVNRVPLDRRTRYKGDAVHVKYLPVTGSLELKRKTTEVLLLMQSLRNENLNPFIGCLCEVRPALVFDHCGRGSLEDVLMADDIKLDWTFRLSLLTDLVKGMRYLHGSPLRVHGRLSSRNCVVDSRWVLRVTDFATHAFYRAQGLPEPARTARDLLWTAPELLREAGGEARGTQPGDVFSFAIVMQEVVVRGEPYCMLALTPDEIVEKVRRPPPLIRPSVSMGAAPPEAVSIMRQCWAEAPDHRPDFHRLHDIFRHLHKGRKINIVDSMFEMLEKYSNNLEELIKERTEELDMEKKKTEQLLNRMLPRSVAERLMLGSRVEPEEFEEVSIYFSDIVGFTALAARSTPVQVVDLLNDLYTTFDAAIEQYRVYKVETIGDAYMVVGGLPVRARDHAESVATMALHLLHLAGRFRVRHLPDTPLHLRIGLHSGPCCAAVVGLTMPRYCLFGDTVNTASRMESTGAAWRIQVSAATAERLAAAGGYRLRSRGLTQVKGKGAMHTYWLLDKEGFDKPLPTPPPLESEEVLFETDGENESEASSPCTDPPAGLQPARDRHGTFGPRAAQARLASVAVNDMHARYRCLAGGARALRRQWSLERGEALAVAAAGAAGAPEPLALLAAAPPGPRAATPRYRTRRDAPDEDAAAARFFP